MADDLGYADVGFNGSKWFETPALDALADQSLVFDNAYMYPTCSPSRSALLTGRQSFRTGVYTVPVLERAMTNKTFSHVGRSHTNILCTPSHWRLPAINQSIWASGTSSAPIPRKSWRWIGRSSRN
ncbi:MAG: sulfatase-like hydrolase/transferase [Rubripirellula sp.]